MPLTIDTITERTASFGGRGRHQSSRWASRLSCSSQCIPGRFKGIWIQGASTTYPDPAPALFDLSSYSYPDLTAGTNVALKVDSTSPDDWIYVNVLRDEFLWVMSAPPFYYTSSVYPYKPFPGDVLSPQIQSKVLLSGPCRGTLITFPPTSFGYPGTFPIDINRAFYWEYTRDDPWANSGSFPAPVAAEYVHLKDGDSLEITVDMPVVSEANGNQNTPFSVKMFRWDRHPSEFAWYPL